MSSNTTKVLGALLAVAVFFGSRFGCKAYDSRRVREAAYQRYSELGTPEEVKAAVDAAHDECFERTYKIGGRHRSNQFEVDAYAKEMDRSVLPRLRDSESRTVAAAIPRRPQPAPSLEPTAWPQATASPLPAPVVASATPVATPLPAGPHRLEIRSLELTPMSAAELRGLAVRGFRLRATVFDEAGDVQSTPAPQGNVEVSCQGAQAYARATSMPSVTRQDAQTSRVEVTLALPDHVVNPGCLLVFALTDPAGNRGSGWQALPKP